MPIPLLINSIKTCLVDGCSWEALGRDVHVINLDEGGAAAGTDEPSQVLEQEPVRPDTVFIIDPAFTSQFFSCINTYDFLKVLRQLKRCIKVGPH